VRRGWIAIAETLCQKKGWTRAAMPALREVQSGEGVSEREAAPGSEWVEGRWVKLVVLERLISVNLNRHHGGN